MGASEDMDSMIKRTLKSLCCSNGWSYGVFWRFDQRNSMLLTLEDAYYEDQMGVMIDNMLLQVHMLGEGIIGQAAFTGNHQWMLSDAHCGEQNHIGSIENRDIFQDDSDEFRHQFSSGIKTIAVISVGPRGVVQFGSTQKILERLEFLDLTKRLFQEMENGDGLILSENAPSSSTSEINDPNGFFASLISSGNPYYGNLKPVHRDSCKELMGKPYSSTNLALSSPFTSEMHRGRMTPLTRNSSHFRNQLQTVGAKAQVILSDKFNTQLQQVFLHPTASVNNSATQTPCFSSWSSGGSTLTSFEQQLPSEMTVQGSPNMFPAKADTLVSSSNTVQNFQEDSTFTSLYSAGELVGVEKTTQYSSGKLMDKEHSAPLIHATEGELLESSISFCTFQEEFKPGDFTTALSKSQPVDNLSPWLAPSPEQGINRLATTLNDDLSQAIGVTSVSSGLDEGDIFFDIPVNHPAISMQSSVTNTFSSYEKEKSLNVPGAENDLFDSLGLDFGCGQAGQFWDDIIMPVASGGQLSISTGISERIPGLDVGFMAGPRKGLFSELGLEQLLDDIVGNSNSVTKSSSEDHLSTTKRRRAGCSSVNSNQAQLSGLSCLGRSMNLVQPEYNLDKTTNLGTQKEVVPKSQVGLWIDDSYSINAGGPVITQPKRPEEPAKATKKRARPGESTRPRPKDRQQIQDRVKELREIIPTGAKCSIDALLDRTIKHMLFLQSVTKYADKLKQTEEPKLICQESGVVLKDSSSNGGGGATWAFEVGGQTMVCPIIVEDLSPPGQMLIEMLCEERGFFLEIADIIQGFGLTILKGVMEVRENKIWARFIVEAKRHVTRMDIFLSLVQLLQQTATSGINSTDQPSDVNGGIPLLNNYQQPAVPLPMSLPDPLR